MKRAFDLLASAIALVMFLPLLMGLSLVIWARLGSPVFFLQSRPGLHGRPFKMIKFRTMTDQCDAEGELLPDAVRLTPFGHFLRATSLDELPELINILKGDMSMVGPRPLLMEYLPLYNARQAKRHDVRPGLTGWAQINGRNALSWEDKFESDVWYVENRNFWLDLKIIFLTIKKVLVREGISAAGEATMSRFMGTK